MKAPLLGCKVYKIHSQIILECAATVVFNKGYTKRSRCERKRHLSRSKTEVVNRDIGFFIYSNTMIDLSMSESHNTQTIHPT